MSCVMGVANLKCSVLWEWPIIMYRGIYLFNNHSSSIEKYCYQGTAIKQHRGSEHFSTVPGIEGGGGGSFITYQKKCQ